MINKMFRSFVVCIILVSFMSFVSLANCPEGLVEKWSIGIPDDSISEFSPTHWSPSDYGPYTYDVDSDIYTEFPKSQGGPDEHPAGNLQTDEYNPLTISFDIDQMSSEDEFVFNLDITDMQNYYSYAQNSGWNPPQPYGRISFDVKVNGNQVYSFDQTYANTGEGVLDNEPSLEVEIPIDKSYLSEGPNQLVIDIKDGDWIAYDYMQFCGPSNIVCGDGVCEVEEYDICPQDCVNVAGIPEFSTIGMIVGIMVIAAGAVFVVKKRR